MIALIGADVERPTWETPDGRILYKAETDDHHIFWPRAEQRTRLQRLVRTMGGSILHLAKVSHVELHRELPPPPKANFYLLADIYHHSRRMEYTDQYDVFHQIVDYVGLVASASQNQQNVEDASRLHEHLLAQAVFVEEGRLMPIGRAA